MHVDALLLSLITGAVIPLLTGVITKLQASSGLKAMVSAFLSGVVAFVGYIVDWNGVGTWQQALVVGLIAFVTQAGSYHGFLKPTGIAPAVQESTAKVGIG